MASGMAPPRAEVRRMISYRLTRAFCGAVALVAVSSYVWQVWLTNWRPWEGRGGALHGVARSEVLSGPVAGYVAPETGAQLIEVRGKQQVVLSFRGAQCNDRPASLRAAYRTDVIDVSIDPDPRGCRDHPDEGRGGRDRVLLITLDEPVGARPVVVSCVGSARCEARSWKWRSAYTAGASQS